MALIQILPPEVAAKIAAGEVVERPASVVKELVDNALDAGADRIVVELEDGGRRVIRVSDNGSGMSAEDCRLSVERHSTSKIRSAEDLDAIATFGFRGEALASIAAVTRFEIITRRAEDREGTRLFMQGTVTPQVEPVGCPVGTTVTAADIYFNTPARRKFLKTTATELAAVADMVNRAAIPHHQVHFILRHHGKAILDYPKVASRQERLYAFLGKEAWEQMRPVKGASASASGGSGAVQIEGYVSLPNESRNRADQVYFFVNDRYVQNRMLLSAVMEAYRRILHPGRYPTVILFLYLDPGAIDINVHPKKQEIKFDDEQRVWRAVHSAVREAFSYLDPESVSITTTTPAESPGIVPTPATQQLQPVIPEAPPPPSAQGLSRGQVEEIRRAVNRFYEKSQEVAPKPLVPAAMAPQAAQEQQPAAAALETSAPALFDPQRRPVPVAQVLETYLVCEQAGQLVLVDQHAAAERIRYEHLKRAAEQGAPRKQLLLFPVTIEVAAGQAALLQENLQLLSELGFELEPFGQNTFLVNAVPALFSGEESQDLIKDVLSDLAQAGTSTTSQERREKILVSLACHGSIRAGQRLTLEAMQDLVEQLFRSEHPLTCPHGRPTLVALSESELQKMFKRCGFSR